MKYDQFCGNTVSRLGFGAMRFPTRINGKIDRPRATQMLDAAYRAGVNYFDTAYMYHGGESESFVGEVLSAYPRNSFYLASKMPVWMAKDAADMERIFNEQLSRCKVKYFDYYLLHSIDKTNWARGLSFGAVEWIKEKKAIGAVKKIGFSFHGTTALLKEILDNYDCFEFVQLQLNYLDYYKNEADKQYQVAVEHGLDVVVMEPVRGGTLAKLNRKARSLLTAANPEASIASWALRFVWALPMVKVVLSGMSTEEQVSDNLKNVEMSPLSTEEIHTVRAALRAYAGRKQILCTACRYCTDGCKKGLDIPAVFEAYNEFLTDKNKEKFVADIASHNPDICVSCGSCTKHCPQHLDIPKLLKKISKIAARNAK